MKTLDECILEILEESGCVMTAAAVAYELNDDKNGNEIGHVLRRLVKSGAVESIGRISAADNKNGYVIKGGDKTRIAAEADDPADVGTGRVAEVMVGTQSVERALRFVVQLPGGRWLGCRGAIVRAKADARAFRCADEAADALEAVKA